MFALVDCNNFYASCERVFRPELVGQPIVVLSNNDGCVIARSNEAKDAGVPMGAPAFQYKKIFEEKKVHVFSANFGLYGDMSQRVMNILSTYTPDIEIYSIDEAFLKLDGFEQFDLQEYGKKMRSQVLQWTGIPISVGIAPTKALAKVANRIAKKYQKETGNVYKIDTEEKRIKALKWLKIEDIWGIGRQQAKKLLENNIKTAYEFTLQDNDWVLKEFTVVGLRLKKDLEGIPTLEIEEEIVEKKNISVTRSFERDYKLFEEVKERVATFSIIAAEKLRKQQSLCRAVLVFVRTNRHKLDLQQYKQSIVCSLPFATNSSLEISQTAIKGLSQIFKEGYNYKKAGVILMDFVPESHIQTQLFDSPNPKHQHLMKAIDQINAEIGKQKVKIASQDLDRIWKMNQNSLSPSYTTDIEAIIKVNT